MLLRGVRDRYEARAMGHLAPGRYCIAHDLQGEVAPNPVFYKQFKKWSL